MEDPTISDDVMEAVQKYVDKLEETVVKPGRLEMEELEILVRWVSDKLEKTVVKPGCREIEELERWVRWALDNLAKKSQGLNETVDLMQRVRRHKRTNNRPRRNTPNHAAPLRNTRTLNLSPQTRSASQRTLDPTFSKPAQHITLSRDAVDDPRSWTNLVQDHKRIRCPYCSINAHVIQRQGKTWIDYYKGTRGFVTHLESHKNEFKNEKARHPRYRGSAGKTRRILEAAVTMTKEEEKAHQQHGNGHTSKYPHQLTISISRHFGLKDTSCAGCR